MKLNRKSQESTRRRPSGVTFTWWGCYSLCLRHKPTELAHSFCSGLVSVSVFMALSTVFHSMNSPDLSCTQIVCEVPGIIIIIIIIIIINPLNARVVWAPQMILQPVFSIFSLFSSALWDLPNSRPVHSLMLSSHLFLCPPCLLPRFTVPCKMVLARPDERET